MSDDPKPKETAVQQATDMVKKVGKAGKQRMKRIPLKVLLGLVAFVMLVVAAASWYTTTEDFQRRVGGKVVQVLETATGGRVEIGHIDFSLWHLAVEVDGLVVHGTEGPGELPYLSTNKILVRLQINTFLTNVVGAKPRSHIGLKFLRVEQPRFHLTIDANGKTNQPVPKHPSTSTEPVQDTLLDLQAEKVELADGLAVINDRAIPFDLAANQLNAEVHYLPASDHYAASLNLADLRTKMQELPEVQSKLRLTAEFGRDMADLQTFDYTTGNATELKATAMLNHFAKPEWTAAASGQMDMKQVSLLTGLEGFPAGKLELDLHGRNCVVPAKPVAKQHFWQGGLKLKKAPVAPPVSPTPNATVGEVCSSGFLVTGAMKVHGLAYRNEYVRFHDLSGGAQVHVTPQELLLSSLTGALPEGGDAVGEMRMTDWLGKNSKTTIKARTNRLGLRSIMDTTGPPAYGDLGFDTSCSGPVDVSWDSSTKDVSDNIQVEADLRLEPQGIKRRGALDNTPVSGELHGHYDGRTETVKVQRMNLQTPASSLVGNGILGVNLGDPLTVLQVNLQTRDLCEFDQLLHTLDLEGFGKVGTAAIPAVLHGTLSFTGIARGEIENLEAKGHLQTDNLQVTLGPTADIHIDQAVADLDFTPNGGLSLASSTVKRGTAVLNVGGSFKPHKVLLKHNVVDYVWDDSVAIDATAKLANAQATDLLQIAGQDKKVPVTGTVNLSGHAAGLLKSLNGTGTLTLKNGVAYGEGYQLMNVDVAAQDNVVHANKVLVQAHDMSVTGSGAYNLTTRQIQAKMAGSNLLLSKLDTFKKARPDADASLSFSADADGTMEQPNLHAKADLVRIVVGGKALGDLNATAYSKGSDVFYDLHSTLVGAQLVANGQTSLLAGYQTQAKLMVSGYDIANTLELFAPGTVKGSSRMSGSVSVSGPLAKPEEMNGSAEFSDVDLKLEGVELKAAEPLKASLRNGTLTLDQIHITGQDTDLRAGGTARLFGDANPMGGVIKLSSSGSVSMALAHTFDPDLITSGKVTFNVLADGRVGKPAFTGNVKFDNVNIAVDGIPNGLSAMNGTLAFNENRLDVTNLTATTGGGQLKIGGSLIYKNGLFADLTATGDAVRVRLYGLSATATSSFKLQGSSQSLTLSGNVLITRFGVGADVDFAAFAGAGGLQTPPEPDAASNKIRLDVHVTSAPQLDFQNSYAKLAGTVDLNVRGTIATPSVLGRIQITDGSASFAGTKYELNRGSVTFNNPVRNDPVIDLDATAKVENYNITLGLQGTLNSFKTTYRSEPPLSETDIINLLALGRTQEEAQIYSEQQTQAGGDPTTNALLGGALNATVSNRVGKLFGAGSVKIDPSFVGTLGNSAARITVSEPISKELTLVFATNVNQTAQQLIQLQYQLNPTMALVATRDENGVYSIVYKLRKRYK